MNLKWIGAVCIITGCSGWGILLANGYHRQVILLDQLRTILHMMRWELCYRCVPLPDLCVTAAENASGVLRKLFYTFAENLDKRTEPDAQRCMRSAVRTYNQLPPSAKRILLYLGRILGRYDLEGQLQGLDQVIEECTRAFRNMENDREIRIKSYRTLGMCAGAALAVLFI